MVVDERCVVVRVSREVQRQRGRGFESRKEEGAAKRVYRLKAGVSGATELEKQFYRR